MKFILSKCSFILLPIFVLSACISGNSSLNKQRDLRNLTSIISNPSVTGDQAIAICGPQARLAKSQASADADSGSRNRRRTYDMDCSFGSCRATDVTPSGGMWGGINRALTAANAGKGAYNAVMDSCLASYGWRY